MDAEDFSMASMEKRVLTGERSQKVSDNKLSLRERFRRVMFFQEVDKLPNFEFGYWDRTLENWRRQGLPDWVVDERTAYEYFGIENWTWLPVNTSLTPVFEYKVLEETEEYITYRDESGCVAQINKKGDRSIPHYLDFPIKNRETWQPFKKALDPEDPRRYAHLWAAGEEPRISSLGARSVLRHVSLREDLERLRSSDLPVGVSGGSLIGIPRNLIGFEHIAILSYEDPEFFEEIVNTFGECICGVLERVLPLFQVDFCLGWEDFCFNQGPVVSPDVLRRVAGPWYRRIADLLVAHGCCIYSTDTDGNILPVVDVFLDNGLNTMFPVEVHAGSDPVLLRRRYGKRIRLWGGVDKMALIKSKQAIDAELQRLLPVVEQGGFIPTVDHRVPADVPLDHYKHYMDRKRGWFGVGGEPKY